MKRRKNRTFATTIELACGNSYQFRYLINESIWLNDEAVDGYVPTPFGGSDNSVLEAKYPERVKKTTKRRAWLWPCSATNRSITAFALKAICVDPLSAQSV